MAFNGSGTFNLYTPGNPVVTGTTISSTWANNTLSDIATGLSTCITKDGQTTVTAAIPFANNRLTGIGAATALTDAVRANQVQNSSLTYLTSVSGTDTITATAAITPAAYAAGQMFQFVAAGANTGAVTLNVSGLGAKDVTKNGSTALTAGDIPSGATISVMYDGTRFQLVRNGAISAGAITTSGITMSTARILGRTTAGTGAVEELTVSGGMLGGGALTLGIGPGVKQGYTLSNNGSDATNDIDIAAGKAVDSTGTVVMSLASTMVKRLDANWAPGTNQGGRYSGAAIADTTYHVWLVAKAAGADVDVYMDPSEVPATVLGHLQAESGGASYLYLWRIGSILRESAAIVPFTQYGNYFQRNTLSAAVSATNPGTSAVTRIPNGLPAGIVVEAVVLASMALSIGTAGAGLISALTAADEAPSVGGGVGNFGQPNSAFTAQGVASEISVMTNTSSQVRTRVGTSDANTVFRMITRGWRDISI